MAARHSERFSAFDPGSISDVVLHIRFTARQGVVASNVVTALEDLFQQAVSGEIRKGISLKPSLETGLGRRRRPSTLPENRAAPSGTLARNGWLVPIDRLCLQAGPSLCNFPSLEARIAARSSARTHGKTITITEIAMRAENVAKHHLPGNPAGPTTDLAAGSFVFSAPPDPAGPTQVLTRNVTTQVFIIVRYTLSP